MTKKKERVERSREERKAEKERKRLIKEYMNGTFL